MIFTGYRAFGLRIQSSCSVPGALPLLSNDTHRSPDLVITDAPDLSEDVAHVEPLQTHQFHREPSRLVYEKSQVARFLCDLDGTHITIHRFTAASSTDVEMHLIANALPTTLWIKDQLVLHAAAAVLPGMTRALIFTGASGAGKSTLLKELMAKGCSVVAEDSLCIRRIGTEIEVTGLPGCLFLRSPGAALRDPRRMVQVSPSQSLSAARVAAIVMLANDATEREQAMLRLSSVEALKTLLRHRHRPVVPRLLEKETGQLTRWAALASLIPVYSWNREERTGKQALEELFALSIDSSLAGEGALESSNLGT